QRVVAGGESLQAEFKRTTGQRTDAARTICGMLNASGGFVIFGVTDDGRIRGQQVTAATLADVARELGRIDPQALLSPEAVELEDGSALVVVRVPRGDGPYTYDGRPYLRVGSTTVLMGTEEYQRRLVERMHSATRWETQAARGVTLADLDADEIIRTAEEAMRRNRLVDPGSRRIEDLLLGFGLLRDGELLNAAVVLFCRAGRLMPLYPQCTLRLARFRGRDMAEFEDNQQETGNAFQLFMRAQRFLRDHLPVAGRIIPGLFERVDDPLYPPVALREALANALCHRDYGVHGGSVGIAIFDDRLEISSTGPLRFGLRAADLTGPHPSLPWPHDRVRPVPARNDREVGPRHPQDRRARAPRRLGAARVPRTRRRGGRALLSRRLRASHPHLARTDGTAARSAACARRTGTLGVRNAAAEIVSAGVVPLSPEAPEPAARSRIGREKWCDPWRDMAADRNVHPSPG
ncbi:MAG TPA: RNA-binding domain-containing protein, partial [Longimicrobium sp.]|nr:RNA-binding domain-containing protein [Longimicrobium sp.]